MEQNARPASRTRPLFLVAAAVLLAIAGVIVGQLLARPDDIALIEPGTVIEVHLDTGQIVLGVYAGEDASYLILSAPATLAAGSDEDATLSVRSMAVAPQSIAGNVLVERAQVVLIGAIQVDSDLYAGYLEATGAAGSPAPASPSPGS